MGNTEFQSKLERAIARRIGSPGSIRDLKALTGGANRTTWSFEADVSGKREHFILQLSASTPTGDTGEQTGPLATLGYRPSTADSARLIMEAVKVGVPAPIIRAVLDDSDGIGEGYITEFVEGETLAPRILRDDKYAHARTVMAQQCGTILAKIHSIDLASVPFLKPIDMAGLLEVQRTVVDFYQMRHPAIEMGLKWVAEHLPKHPRQTPVHGDFRLGNLIVGEEGIRLVLDWEICQAGDPMQDLAWVCVKTWRFGGKKPVGGFGTREDLFAAYEKQSGHRVDPAHVRFWEAYGGVKWAIGCLQLGMRGVQENNVERCAIGRRIEEPLWDFLNLIEGRD